MTFSIAIPLAVGEQDGQESCHRLILRLKAALSQFDNASIYTIHGFCQRVLRDYAVFIAARLWMSSFRTTRARRLLIPAQDFGGGRSSNRCHIGTIGFDRKCTPEEMLAEIQSYTGRLSEIPDGLKAICKKPKVTFRNMAKKFAAVSWKTWKKVFWTNFPKLNGQTTKKNL